MIDYGVPHRVERAWFVGFDTWEKQYVAIRVRVNITREEMDKARIIARPFYTQKEAEGFAQEMNLLYEIMES